MRKPSRERVLKNMERKFASQFHSCGWKLRHDNILTAMAHAAHVSRLRNIPYMFYECEHCGFIHVGKMQITGNFMYGGWCVNAAELQMESLKAETLVQQQQKGKA